MRFINRSMHSGKIHEMEIDITQEQLDNWRGGELIQKAMPNLTPDEREFLITGILPNEWEELHGTDRTDH